MFYSGCPSDLTIRTQSFNASPKLASVSLVLLMGFSLTATLVDQQIADAQTLEGTNEFQPKSTPSTSFRLVDSRTGESGKSKTGVLTKNTAIALVPKQQLAVDQNDNLRVRFSFQGTPWRDVIDWIAEESQLALHLNDVPTGSFTYSDPNDFSHQQAIDRINLFLLPQQFTLVRSGQLLTLINLSDPRSKQQLDSIATLVTVDQLMDRESHDVVKCIFPLGDIDVQDAVEEISVMNLMTEPSVFSKTNQLMLTDTARKLKNVKTILDAFVIGQMTNDTVVKSFPLSYVSAEDVLVVARPHLGLATDEMIGIDVSLSADLEGKTLFVTGVEEKAKLLNDLVRALDRPKQTMTNSGENILQTHSVDSGNLTTVYNVLLTMLAGKEVRLSVDQDAGSIVALATPAIQQQIDATVQQLKASAADFEIIPLRTVDPYFVISLLEEMFDLPDAATPPGDIDPNTPRIDADPGNMRLFVRAKTSQIEQIKKIVAGLDGPNNPATIHSDSRDLRILPLIGDEARQALVTASKFWRGVNPIILFRSIDDSGNRSVERVVMQDSAQTASASDWNWETTQAEREPLYLTNTGSRSPAIRCQVTERGLLLQSDDIAALGAFAEHVQRIAGPMESLPATPIIYYLKYTKADQTLRILAKLLDGGESVQQQQSVKLVNGYVSSMSTGGFLGSFVSNSDGTTTMRSGSVTVVADSRLNRLIAQGTMDEITRIESYLKILDKDNSIIDIEINGPTRVIELQNTRATKVADVIRQAFSNRISVSANRKNQSSDGKVVGSQRSGTEEKSAEGRKDQNSKKSTRSAAVQVKDLEPKMTLAVHEASNSIIVTAPDGLFRQVENLAKSVDERSEQAIEIITPASGKAFENVLQQLLLGKNSSRTGTRSATSSRSTNSGNKAGRGRGDY